MADRLTFTKPVLERSFCPEEDERIYLYDAKVPGLAVCITRNGSRSFYLYRRVRGRPQRIRLGGFPELSIEQAHAIRLP